MKTLEKKFSLAELASLVEATLIGDGAYIISGVETLESATAEDASFLANPRYADAMRCSQAGVICISPQDLVLPGKNFFVSDNPSRTFQKLVELFLPVEWNRSGFTDIHPTAVIHPTAHISKNVQIGPYAVIDQFAEIGEGTTIHASVSIGPYVQIGNNCVLYPHCVVRERCTLGNRVILQPGAVIGSCGFGYTTDAMGKHTKLDQLGIVILEDDVEIGANTTIDRSRFKITRIGKGTKIDNLVQIGHNVILGQDNIIVSQTGIAGSTKTGKNVVMGGQAGIVGHIEIGDHVMIATRGGVSKSIKQSGKYAGSPVMPLADYNRQQVHLRKIAHYVDILESLQEGLKEDVPNTT